MSDPTADPPKSIHNKNNPFLAKIIERRLLSKEGSIKQTVHYAIDIGGSDLRYRPGYSLGVFGKNPKSTVDEVMDKLRLDPGCEVPQKEGPAKPLREVMLCDVTLNRVGKKFVQAVAEKLTGEKKAELTGICEQAEKMDEYVFTRDYVDVLNEYPVAFTCEEFLGAVSRSVPRLYSIASSQAKSPDQVHLTIATVRYETHGRSKRGLVSGYLADDAELNTHTLPVFLTPNKHFKLPDDPSVPVIMVGPGTGIAPFRAFLQQRECDGSKGKNWLFFGDQHKDTDFLYEEDFDQWMKSELLTKLDTAFSRDQAHKIYVQHRIEENAEEIWKWLQDGAYFYVCGDAKRMAKDVEQALIDLTVKYGGMSPEAASDYVIKTLGREERRYLKDVY